MSLGSPALAAYSLAITSLNARLVYCRTKSIKHESKRDVARALISLQQIPLELTKDERLLAFIPIDDRWRQEIAGRLNRRNAWSLAAGSSVAWVVTAFVFTLVDSFVSLDNSGSQGHAVGTLWLWLLCLVICWLWVPIFSSSELKTALNYANHQAVKKAAKKFRQAKESTRKAMGSAKIKLARKIPKGLRGSKKSIRGPVTVVVEENEKERSTQEDSEHLREGTNQEANPLLNPSHHQSVVSFQTHPESHQSHDHLTVSANPNAHQSAVSMARSSQISINPETDKLLISQELTSLNRDEHRLTATFNHSRLMRYLVLVDDVLTAFDKLGREKDEVGFSRKCLTEVVSLILNRRGRLALGTFPLCLRRRRMHSLGERSPRCSTRRLWPSFSSAEQLLQPQSSYFLPRRLDWGAVLWDTPSTEQSPSLSCSSPSSRRSLPGSRKPARRDPPSSNVSPLSSPSLSAGSPSFSRSSTVWG